jgi:hypothetical protein
MTQPTQTQIKLKSPQSWEDITLDQYVKLIEAGEKYDLKDAIEVVKYRLEQVHILNPQYTLEEIGLLTLPQLQSYYKQIEFLDDRPVLRECKQLTIDGKVYTFQDFKMMSLEQWIDTEKYSNLREAHKLIAIFYIPAQEYNTQEHDKVSDYLLHAPATEYFWSASFFLFTHLVLGRATELFSENLLKQKATIDKVQRKVQKIKNLKKNLLNKLGFK